MRTPGLAYWDLPLLGVRKSSTITAAVRLRSWHAAAVLAWPANLPSPHQTLAPMHTHPCRNFIVAIFITVADNEETPEHAKAAPANAA